MFSVRFLFLTDLLINFAISLIVVVLLVLFIILTFDILQDVRNVAVPFKGGIRHTKVDLSLLFGVTITGLLRDFHSSIEMLST